MPLCNRDTHICGLRLRFLYGTRAVRFTFTGWPINLIVQFVILINIFYVTVMFMHIHIYSSSALLLSAFFLVSCGVADVV